MNNDEIVVPILRAINDLREEVRDNKREIREMREENNKRWDENDKRWEENDKRWEENRKRWEENEKRWKENDKRWEKYEIDRKTDHRELLDILTQFDRTISKKIGDPNADKMKKIIDISKIKR